MSTRIHAALLAALFGILLAAAPAALGQTTWYVDDDAPPGGDGSSANPFNAIQAGIDASGNGDTVLVLDGTYTGDGNRDLDFGGKAITVRSENGPDGCIIDSEGDPNDPHRGFYFCSGEGPDSVVEGLTITNGYDSGNGGGGVYCRNSSPKITNCTISGNSTTLDGGGVNCYYSNPTLTGCTISGNSAPLFGGGVFCHGSNPTLNNCTISGNSAPHYGNGGGVCCYVSSTKIINCTISGNSTFGIGGGLLCYGSCPTITNCTISGNSADYHGGGVHCEGGGPTITNCVLWGNTPQEIYFNSSSLTVTYSDVQGSWSGDGNINADPQFVDPENGDHHLQTGSPCIDAGTNDPTGGLPAEDLDGNPRPVDGDGDVEPWSGQAATADMGAYEYQSEFCFGDLDGDYDVDLSDLATLLANYGMTSGAAYEDGDLDADGDVDLSDLAALLAVYGTTCP